MIVQNNSECNLLAYQVPSISIELRKSSKEFKKYVLKEFKNLIEEVNCTISYRDYLSQGKLSIASEYLLSAGAATTPVFSAVIDLNQMRLN